MSLLLVIDAHPMLHDFPAVEMAKWEPRAACGCTARAPQVVFALDGERCPLCVLAQGGAPPAQSPPWVDGPPASTQGGPQ